MLLAWWDEMSGCPVCGEVAGFHDEAKHKDHQVPAELLLESGWYKEESARISKERQAEKEREALKPNPGRVVAAADIEVFANRALEQALRVASEMTGCANRTNLATIETFRRAASIALVGDVTNHNCTNCHDTRGGSMGHDTESCTWSPPEWMFEVHDQCRGDELLAEVAALTAERDRLREELAVNDGIHERMCDEWEAERTVLTAERDAALASLAEARTWRGVQAFIDEQYPADVFPVEPDSEQRDDGARILSLLRHLDEALRVVDMHHWPLPASLAEERKQGIAEGRRQAAVDIRATSPPREGASGSWLTTAELCEWAAQVAADASDEQTALCDAVVEAARAFVASDAETPDETGWTAEDHHAAELASDEAYRVLRVAVDALDAGAATPEVPQ